MIISTVLALTLIRPEAKLGTAILIGPTYPSTWSEEIVPKGIFQDIKVMKTVLTTAGFEVEVLEREGSTKSKIREALDRLENAAAQGYIKQSFIYFSGIGSYRAVEDTEGKRTKLPSLVPADGERNRGDKDVPMAWFEKVSNSLEDHGIKSVICIEASFGPPPPLRGRGVYKFARPKLTLERQIDDAETAGELFNGKGVFLCSSTPSTISYEHDTSGSKVYASVFTSQLADYLEALPNGETWNQLFTEILCDYEFKKSDGYLIRSGPCFIGPQDEIVPFDAEPSKAKSDNFYLGIIPGPTKAEDKDRFRLEVEKSAKQFFVSLGKGLGRYRAGESRVDRIATLEYLSETKKYRVRWPALSALEAKIYGYDEKKVYPTISAALESMKKRAQLTAIQFRLYKLRGGQDASLAKRIKPTVEIRSDGKLSVKVLVEPTKASPKSHIYCYVLQRDLFTKGKEKGPVTLLFPNLLNPSRNGDWKAVPVERTQAPYEFRLRLLVIESSDPFELDSPKIKTNETKDGQILPSEIAAQLYQWYPHLQSLLDGILSGKFRYAIVDCFVPVVQ